MVFISSLHFPDGAPGSHSGARHSVVRRLAHRIPGANVPAVRSVLVVGAGAAGTATAILLAEAGVSVDLIDVKPDVSTLGSGITLQGNALRVLRQLGVWDQVAQRGFAFDTLGLRAPDP